MTEVSMNQIKIKQKDTNFLEGRYYLIDQKLDMLECIFCCFCEGSNEYAISQSDPNFNVSNKKGYIKQDSDCLSRVICVCNRPFSAKLNLFNKQIAVAQRPCRCCLEYMPCQENQLIVKNKSDRVLGTLRVGCWCCVGLNYACTDAQIQIYSGENNQLIYTVEGSYCQKSIFCPCFRCCYCPNIEYTIFDNVNLKVGKILNLYNGCFSQILTRTDKFGIQFPPRAQQQHKILLLYASLYLDYLRYQTPYCCLGIR